MFLSRIGTGRLWLTAALGLCSACSAAAQGAGNVLFVRGADRSGGFLEANNDSQRTEQLADINNTSTSGGNHGWFEFSQTLQGAGYTVQQITETAENASGPSQGIAVPFASMDLSVYDVVVFGSNNAAYGSSDVDAVDSYIRGGGSALFISDANFGGSWADASDSDQHFLDRLGLIAHQDQGTYQIQQSEFITPEHPILDGIDRFDGEGVTPVRFGSAAAEVRSTVLARAEGNTRLNQPPFGNNMRGPSRASVATDAALMAVTANAGRVVVHFDRNTFFNQNGAGTNINRFDNRDLALNIFAWLADASIIGDYNGDGFVSQADLDLVLLNWGQTDNPSPAGWTHDQSTDTLISQADLDEVLLNWGNGTPPEAASIPEPGAAALVVLGALALRPRRRGGSAAVL